MSGRRGQFRVGWHDATLRNEAYSPDTLTDLTCARSRLSYGSKVRHRRRFLRIHAAFDQLADQFSPNRSDRCQTWIFQGSPQIYDVKTAIRELNEFHWLVRQHKSAIRVGDLVYIWASGPDGGLLGTGTVLTEATECEQPEAEKQYWINQPEERVEPRIRIKREQIFEQPITRQELIKSNQGSLNFSLLRAPQGTNFSVNKNEAQILNQITADRPTIEQTLRRYADQNVVFQGAQRGALYAITDVDETGFSVDRLSALMEPQRCTIDAYYRAVDQVRSQGGNVDLKDFASNTVAQKIGVLQGAAIDLSLDHRSVIDLKTTNPALLKHFCQLLGGLNVDQSSVGAKPRLYKPAMMACLIEAIGDGAISENRIDFDFIEPRFIEKLNELGQDGGSQQAAYAFFYLANDLFWMLAYKDVHDRIEPSRISPKSISRPSAVCDVKRRLLVAFTKTRQSPSLSRRPRCQMVARSKTAKD